MANVIERAVINAQSPVLHIADHLESDPEESSTSSRTLDEVEKEHILRTLDAASWKIEGPNGAAKCLGLNPSTLRTRMVKLGIQRSIRAIAGNSLPDNKSHSLLKAQKHKDWKRTVKVDSYATLWRPLDLR